MKNLLFKAFYQGKDEEFLGAGNCASVALIKAAMFTFGHEVISYVKEGKDYKVTLKNGDSVSFSEDELSYAKKESSFIIGKSEDENEKKEFQKILDFAHLCFAVICKMAQLNGDFSSRFSKFIIPENFEIAVEIINDGTLTPQVYEFLGLEEHVTPTFRYKLKKRVKQPLGMVIWTKSHAMYCSEGSFDRYGKKEKFDGRIMAKLPGKLALGIFQVKP
ncbi:hypothetical protein SYJ56_19280 [Algoriphagus sp. D3-2-R+10]|uniref:hypothetical protein n=1 Tax=Algoriphagus aurantiacus TaxID=3103948 RepID=UPI002B3958F5|nr:hypothetical protein [Algoriphagus sp. D3-2-R+10]MEB2777466.1 hypothetical protein [Algoriphagus sp. D3-2-R+10]